MIIEIVCDGNLNNIFYILKTILDIIMIIAPILAIVSLSMTLLDVTMNPDNKKNISKLKNSIIALMIVFLIPVLINIVSSIVGEKTSLTSCWNNARRSSLKTKYYEKENKSSKKTKVYTDTKNYHGTPDAPSTSSNSSSISSNLNFSCTSSKVKAQFSCDTLRIVEKHLYDFNANTFNSVISNKYGSFDAYAKSLGGIFGEYYGKKMPNKTETDFQRAAEYVLGWMYMYGWEYYSTDGTNAGTRVKWKGNDAFYAKGGFVGRYLSDSNKPQYTGIGTNFDGVISTKSQGGSTGRMASACGDLEFFVFNKLNINRKKQLPKVSRLKELKVGDCLYFGNGPKWNKFDESNWSSAYGAHNVIIGEVYKDHVVIYDGGSYYPTHNNYKRNLYFPKEDTEAADDAAVKKVFGYSSWGIRRWYSFEK